MASIVTGPERRLEGGFAASVLRDGAVFTAAYRNGVAATETELLALGIEFKNRRQRPNHLDTGVLILCPGHIAQLR